MKVSHNLSPDFASRLSFRRKENFKSYSTSCLAQPCLTASVLRYIQICRYFKTSWFDAKTDKNIFHLRCIWFHDCVISTKWIFLLCKNSDAKSSCKHQSHKTTLKPSGIKLNWEKFEVFIISLVSRPER